VSTRLFLNLGGFLGGWVYGKESGEGQTYGNNVANHTASYSSRYEFDSDRDNRFDGGLLVGFGIEAKIADVSLFAEGRYQYSMSDLQKPYQKVTYVAQHNSTWQIRAGVIINAGIFGGKK
jgi:hypothetical protein